PLVARAALRGADRRGPEGDARADARVKTGSVNRVWLTGWMSTPPVIDDGRCRLVVATRDDEHIERHTVVASGGLVAGRRRSPRATLCTWRDDSSTVGRRRGRGRRP